ncbi:hypothetical protein ACRALDRAFT_2023323 [Sodiomyces alcalophilus JCM 7366]|uniref:uncharacterized protein n=1 Tax=Sodiomyces alcalophilus JCM 7366 TaxID=591952 RepID=UPI0039B4071C
MAEIHMIIFLLETKLTQDMQENRSMDNNFPQTPLHNIPYSKTILLPAPSN